MLRVNLIAPRAKLLSDFALLVRCAMQGYPEFDQPFAEARARKFPRGVPASRLRAMLVRTYSGQGR